MPLQIYRQTKYKPDKVGMADWDSFRRGLNTFLRETEINKNALSKMDNLMLTGLGVPTKRWGSANYFLAGATGYVRGLGAYRSSAGVKEVLALTDWGYMVKKNGASYTMITGSSWASGYDAQMVQLNNNEYIVTVNDFFTKYNGTALSRFQALSVPANLTATNLSGVSGTFTYSWRVSAESEVGETLASTRVVLGNLPQEFDDTLIRLTWTGSTPASTVQGYVIYKGDAGNERFLTRVNASTLLFDDDGSILPSLLASPPTADSTGGYKAKYIKSFDSRLVLAGEPNTKSRVFISGRGVNAELFHWSQGGAWIDIDPDSGDDITGLGVYNNKLIVFKEKSIWEVTISEVTIGNYSVTYPVATAISKSRGCIAPKSIVAVENDLFFLSADGVFVLGYEPNIQNVLRTNELSVPIRTFFDAFTWSDLQNATAGYMEQKYVLSFMSAKKTIMYDRERLAWVGPAITPYGIIQWHNYESGSAKGVKLAGTDDSYVTVFSDDYKRDRSTAFTTELRTRKEDFGDWSRFKKYRDVFLNLQNVSGSLTMEVVVESRSGQSNIVNSFTISDASSSVGWGGDGWANNQWADSDSTASATDITDIVKRIIVNKSARSIQIRIRTTNASDDYELLGVLINARPQGTGSRPLSWKV